MTSIEAYKAQFLDYLNDEIKVKEPTRLYDPIHYILQLGGKRLRPVLTLLTCDLFGGDSKKALNAALAIEVFHNFTLIHDDIMDSAPIRRGQTTVHEKWDLNTGILSGDAMMILANRCLEAYDAELFKRLMLLFNKTALEVCEGQQYDMDFETRDDVTIPEYLKMITYKTSVLVACAMKMGAIIAGASDAQASKIYEFGLNLGIAFQLQDDYLDTFGDESFGKQIGGDIMENKKTFLYLKALELSTDDDRKALRKLYDTEYPEAEKVLSVTTLFMEYGVQKVVLDEIKLYTEKAFDVLEELTISNSGKEVLREFGSALMQRTI